MKKNKKIIFEASTEFAEDLTESPSPAIVNIPKWYKNQKLFSNGESDYFKAMKKGANDATYKLCVPLVDSITSGYIIKTSADVVVLNVGTKENYIPHISWRVDWSPLDNQNESVLGDYPVPIGHNKTVFRWSTDWKIKTPEGYSCWVTHPSHRFDLPFTTLTGFIDTDKHPNQIFIPFFIHEGFEGVIKQGTPIAQIIPVKRDIWESEKIGYDFKRSNSFISRNLIKVNMVRVYKNKFWTKKVYR